MFIIEKIQFILPNELFVVPTSINYLVSCNLITTVYLCLVILIMLIEQ